MLHMLATLAEYERELIVERIDAGIAAARDFDSSGENRDPAMSAMTPIWYCVRTEIIFQIRNDGMSTSPSPHTPAQVMKALALPVRLEALNFLMSSGPATSSTIARAIGESPSNCSYHLRALLRVGLVEDAASPSARERMWKASVTGVRSSGSSAGPEEAQSAADLSAAVLQLDQRLARNYLANREQLGREWQEAEAISSYALRVSPSETRQLLKDIDALIRPFIAPLRTEAPTDAEIVQLSLQAFLKSAATTPPNPTRTPS
jgi:DNA-binding transcriptional ArsR family regulator